jgi:hypothetical protein
VVSGVRVLSKIVSAVTDVLTVQFAHTHHRPSAVRQPRAAPHARHTIASGQRSRSRCLAHAASSGNHARNSDHVPGYSRPALGPSGSTTTQAYCA